MKYLIVWKTQKLEATRLQRSSIPEQNLGMPLKPMVTTIQVPHLDQQGLKEKDVENYLKKNVPGSLEAVVRNNIYYITAWSMVKIVRFKFRTIAAFEIFCFWFRTNPAFSLHQQLDIKKYTEKLKTDEAAANTVTNEDYNAGGS